MYQNAKRIHSSIENTIQCQCMTLALNVLWLQSQLIKHHYGKLQKISKDSGIAGRKYLPKRGTVCLSAQELGHQLLHVNTFRDVAYQNSHRKSLVLYKQSALLLVLHLATLIS